MPIHLPPFDPSRQFSASRYFRYEGQIYERGDAFPAAGTQVPERKLKQFYETRRIFYMGEETRRQIPYKGPAARAVAQRAAGPEGAELPTVKPQLTETEQAAADLDAQAEKLANANTQSALLQKASGLAGVTKTMKKVDIAKALIKAGRAGDGAA